MIAPATDDRPFLYYQGGSIPAIYLWTLAGILLDLADRACGSLGGPFRAMRPYADLFFMGAAFLLLETKNIATFALLFGTTWLVNALVFAGVLVIVLAAVETTRRFRTPPLPVVFAGIALSLAGRLLRPARLAADAAVRAPADRGGPAGVRADLPGQRGVLQTVRRVRRLPGPRSGSTCWARCSAAAWSTWRC